MATSRFIEIDLAAIPPPDIIETLDFLSLKNEILADAVQRLNDSGIAYNVDTLESDPVVKIVESFAYREMNLRARINDAVRAIMLASAWGTNLDNVGTTFDTPRASVGATPGVAAAATINFTEIPNANTTITIAGTVVTFSVNPANPLQVLIEPSLEMTLSNLAAILTTSKDSNLVKCTYRVVGDVLTITAASPGAAGNQIVVATNVAGATLSNNTLLGGIDPIDGTPEIDDAYRKRVQLAPEAFSSAGPAGAYEYYALELLGPQGAVDATAIMTTPGSVLVTVMMAEDPYAPTADQLFQLSQFYANNDAKPLTDMVSVAGPKIVGTSISATLTLYPGPDSTIVRLSAIQAINGLIAAEKKLGHTLSRSAIIAALQQDGVLSVNLTSPAVDVVADATQLVVVDSIDIQVATKRQT